MAIAFRPSVWALSPACSSRRVASNSAPSAAMTRSHKCLIRSSEDIAVRNNAKNHSGLHYIKLCSSFVPVCGSKTETDPPSRILGFGHCIPV